MKRIINSLIMALLLITMSCKDFLQVNPKSETSINEVFKTDEDFSVAVNGIYSNYQDLYGYLWELTSLRGDDVIQAAIRQEELVNVDNFAVDVNNTVINDAWEGLYDVITSANTVLSRLKEADESIIPNKSQYAGEARFLRALAYFNLVRLFGDVPMIITPITPQEALEIPRSNVDEIYNEVIIKDLQEAEKTLPRTYSSADVGSATSGAAKSLLGRVYLTRHDFDLAESKLMEVTEMGYALLENFEDLFDFENEHHSEYIFDIEYIGGNIGLGSPFTSNFMVEDQDVGSDLVDALKEVYNLQGSRTGGGGGIPNKEFIDLFNENDLRKDRTARTGITNLEGDFVEPGPGQPAQGFTLKYMQPGYNLSNGSNGEANWHIIRYADVLLLYAEALNENGKTSRALNYLNMVHKRAGLEGYSGLSQEETRENIYKERRLELYLEGQRWFDLLRTGRALSAMKKYGMEPHNAIFPIPQSQIEVVNDPSILPQNPGY